MLLNSKVWPLKPAFMNKLSKRDWHLLFKAWFVMHTVLSFTSQLPACLAGISSGQTGPQPTKAASDWSGSTAFFCGVSLTTEKLTLSSRSGCSRLVPVQRGGGLAETHVCALWHSSASWCGMNTVTGPLLSSSSPSSLSSSSLSRPHNGGALMLCFFDQIFELLGSWFRSDRVLLMIPSKTPPLVVPVR